MSTAEMIHLEAEISELRTVLKSKEDELFALKFQTKEDIVNPYTCGLSSFEVSRYSRQMLLPQFGVEGQKKLRDSHVLIIGAGGLGCSAALYLAAAGIGQISIVDNDEVEISNLHRQILHYEHRVGVSKVVSAEQTLKSINSSIRVIPYNMHINATTVPPLFAVNNFDVVIDGSDNVGTHYLLNDACAFLGPGGNRIPLVSGGVLKLEGQLTVYNYQDGPCLRCIFAIAPPPETVTSCGDGGVLGAVAGVIGVLQAIEAIKIITNIGDVLSSRLLTFDAGDATFRNIKLRNKSKFCQICDGSPRQKALVNYEAFCGSNLDDKVHNIDILDKSSNITVDSLKTIPKNSLIIDVRPTVEFDMCHIENTFNFPFEKMKQVGNVAELKKFLKQYLDGDNNHVYLLCRRGNDSQKALIFLNENLSELKVKFINISGGLHSYAKNVDSKFPVY